MKRSLLLMLAIGCVDELPTLSGEPIDAGPDVPMIDADFDAAVDAPIDAGATSYGRRIAAASSHTCAVLGEGQLWCFGSNAQGQLGRPGGDALSPERIDPSRFWVEVSGRSSHTCARTDQGEVYCWGANDEGQLGQGDFVSRDVPTQVPLPERAAVLAAGYNHSCAITLQGELWCWGENWEGQLGQDDRVDAPPEPSPIRVGIESDWIAVRPGQGHTCGVRAAGTLFCFGRNTEAELGLGPGAPPQRRFPTQVDDERWIAGIAGQNHSCGIREDGRFACWGDNTHGQLGTGDLMLRFVPTLLPGGGHTDADTDTFHACAIAASRLSCWGRNVEGQLGLNDLDDRREPTLVEYDDWIEVGVGRFHTCALRSGGTLWCTGANESGKLGVGDPERRRIMTKVWPTTPF